jgi:amino acid adenylation domain-containing protein
MKKRPQCWVTDDMATSGTRNEYGVPADLAERIAKLTPAQRALLDQRLKGRDASRPFKSGNDDSAGAVSFAQERLWFLNQLEPESHVYNITSAFHVQGDLNLNALQSALDGVLRRHEVLRTRIRNENGKPVLALVADEKCEVTVVSLEEKLVTAEDEDVIRLMEAEARRPFDLARDALLRVTVLRLARQEHILLLCVHHIASDAWSMRILYREIAEFYEAVVVGRQPQLPPLPIQYAEYAGRQRRRFQGSALERDLDYWKKQLAGSAPTLALRTDHPRSERQGRRGAREPFLLDGPLTAELKALSLRQGATLFMTLLAALQVLLCRYTEQSDIQIGIPAANRDQEEIENLIGFFVNTLVLRTDLSGDPTFEEVLTRVREVALSAYAHHDLPFEKLVMELHPERNLHQSPLFQVAMVLHESSGRRLCLPDLEIRPLAVDDATSKFDLTLGVRNAGDSISAWFQYDSDLFEASTIRRMISHYRVLLEGAVTSPNTRISELDLLTEPERHRLLVEWNATEAEVPPVCIHQLFEVQAERTPEGTAIRWSGDTISYRELNARADLLARKLRALGVGPDVLVALCLERSPAMIVGVLAVLKAGGAYVPLDPSYPVGRLSFMLVDSGAPVVVIQDHLRSLFPEYNGQFLHVDNLGHAHGGKLSERLDRSTRPDDLCYVIYTSGSTGRPKGVEISHRALVNHMQWIQAEFPLTPHDRVVQRTAYSFDPSVWEFFAPLFVGASLVLATADESRDPHLLTALIQEHEATILQLVPSLLASLVKVGDLERCRSLRRVFCGGEALTADLALGLSKLLNAQIINMYGPTETCIHATFKVSDPNDDGRGVPIGRPLANVRAYVLDGNRQPVPIGVPGELYVGGAGLARGYRDRPDLTADRFVPDPFVRESGARMYRTGDRTLVRPNGDIDFLGRVDDQVKVRGFRVELGEIEAALKQHPAVQEAVVVAREDNGGTSLLAYWVPSTDEAAVHMEALQSFLRQRLPDYMVPSRYTMVDSVPLTPSGKVDRKALPEPVAPSLQRVVIGPRDLTEAELVRVWRSVLQIEAIGVTDSFFDLGGHSLLAVQLFFEIDKLFGRRLPLATLFEAPTIEGLARIVRDEAWRPQWSALVPMQPAGSKPPLFCVHGVKGNVLFYAHLARRLGLDRPFYGLQAIGVDGRRDPVGSVEEMAAAYISEIKTVQPEGPYFLGGFCAGAYIALEIANQLRGQGSEVALLASFNTDGNWKRVGTLRDGFRYHWHNLRRLQASKRPAYILSRLRFRRGRLTSALRRVMCRLCISAGVPLSARLRDFHIEEVHRAATAKYRPSSYKGKVVYFQGSDDSFRDPRPFWCDLLGGQLETQLVPGRGITIFDEPNSQELADRLKSYLM